MRYGNLKIFIILFRSTNFSHIPYDHKFKSKNICHFFKEYNKYHPKK